MKYSSKIVISIGFGEGEIENFTSFRLPNNEQLTVKNPAAAFTIGVKALETK